MSDLRAKRVRKNRLHTGRPGFDPGQKQPGTISGTFFPAGFFLTGAVAGPHTEFF